MKEFWDGRFAEEAFVYGKEPNVWFKTCLDRLNLEGKILLAAEGEGRNAVYAATQGLEVSAFDISVEGRKKALQLATEQGVEIDYRVGIFEELGYDDVAFDALGLIYAHFPIKIRKILNQKLAALVKPKGYVIVEGFSIKHLPYRAKNPKVGGPGSLDMLFSIPEIEATFPDFEVIDCVETEVQLKEGEHHDGLGHVVRFLGQKKG